MQAEDELTIITATDLQRLSGQIIRRAFQGERFKVERDGLPVIVILSITDYEVLQSKSKPKF